MVLESTMICVDDSDYMRNGDFVPSRLDAQQNAINLIFHSKIRSNPENNLGLVTMAKVEVLSTLTNDEGHLISKLFRIQPGGEIHLITALKIAHLALKHREGKNHKMRIIAFVGSPVVNKEEELSAIAKKLKKEKVNVDIVNFGEDLINLEVLTSFINNVNGKDGTSHLVTVPAGSRLTAAVASSPVVYGEDGPEEIRVDDSEDDPELTMALLISMREFREREAEDSQRAGGSNNEKDTLDSTESTEKMKKSKKNTSQQDVTSLNTPVDFDHMTEDEQLIYAIEISMVASDENAVVEEDLSDPAILQRILESLPGVDPNSDEVQQAIRDAKDKKNEESKKKQNK